MLGERGSREGVSTGEVGEEWGTLSPLVDTQVLAKRHEDLYRDDLSFSDFEFDSSSSIFYLGSYDD